MRSEGVVAWQDWLFSSVEDRADLAFDGALPAGFEQIRAVLSERYAVDFDPMLVNFHATAGTAWPGTATRSNRPVRPPSQASAAPRARSLSCRTLISAVCPAAITVASSRT